MTRLSLNLSIKRVLFLSLFSLYHVWAFSQTNILEKSINVPEYKGIAKELINKIENEENIVFAYSSTISLKYEISFQNRQMKLKEFLDILFQGKPIEYKSQGNKILLYQKEKNNNRTKSLRQTVRGTIVDEDSRLPLIGATVSIPGSNPIIGTVTDLEGIFRLENIPVGRIDIQLSYIGYKNVYIPNIEVNSGKEVVLDLKMQESAVKLDEVVVTTGKKKGEAVNDLSLLSARSISVEESKRYTGGMDDPARMVTSYAGVMPTPGGTSDIIARGNSPKYMQWRLDGIEITSPYHMDDQNAAIGTLTALNKYLLTTSDFYTGAFSPEYGNVLSNVMDMRLRNGNNETFEATVGLGLMGTDITMEGPIKKGYKGSYLINYRYSTISAIKDLGLLPGVEGIVSYQDATFKVVLPTKNAGTFSVFGLGGLSGFNFKNIDINGVRTPGRVADASILRDADKDSYLSNIGIKNTLSLTKNSYIKTSLSYSANGINDDLYEKNMLFDHDGSGVYNPDSVSNRVQIYKSRIVNSSYQAASTYYRRFNERNKIQIGTRFITNFSNYKQDIYMEETGGLDNATSFNNHVNSLSNFISWKFNFTNKLTLVSGIHNMNVLLNKKSTIEPRIALIWQINKNNSFHIGYGKHSTSEKVHHYFTRVKQSDGNYIEPNQDLDLLKADHYVMGFKKYFNDYLAAKLEIYYQDLYNLPVENNDTSYFATINEGTDYRYVDLVNEGVGRNYGVELTVERFFDNNYYLVINGSLYESKYKTLEDIWRNTMYNGNYMVNLLWGKEFNNLGKKNNKTLAINTKSYIAGGRRYIPLLRDGNGTVAVEPDNNLYWDYEKAYDNKLVHVYNVNVSVSYKINRKKSTHELFLDLMNIVHSDAKLSEYYDESQPDKIGYEKQMFFLPNIMYRVYF